MDNNATRAAIGRSTAARAALDTMRRSFLGRGVKPINYNIINVRSS